MAPASRRSWPGVFVALEGIDGSGKSTAARAIADRLAQERDLEVIVTREPGGTPLGEAVRSLVLSRGGEGMDPIAELLLFSAARAQHVSDVIEPHLRRGAIVICDRYTDSTLAYQWGGRGLARETILAAQAIATRGVLPDIRVLFDLPVDVAQTRRHGEGDAVNRFDEEARRFHQAVREAYLTLAEASPQDWVVVDAAGTPENIAAAAYRALTQRLPELAPQP
ncbi:MAG: dTMP kinase, partial [Thermomicrobiales bacterium]|nr:dTMP kinase [Thermomicrobiales bacterium]